MKFILGFAAMLLGVCTEVTPLPQPTSVVTPTTTKDKTMVGKAYEYATGQAGKVSKSVGKIFKRKEKTQMTASQYPFYSVQSTSVVNPGQGQFKSPTLNTIQ